MIPPTPSVARALRAEQDAEDDRNRLERLVRKGGVLVLDTPGETIPAVLLSDEPPVDEDARELADAYERGRADAVRDAAAWLRYLHRSLAEGIEEQEAKRAADRLAPKQGAVAS